MKKTICTVMAMAIMMTSAAATAPTRKLGDVVKEAADAQYQVETTKMADSWGLPMTLTVIRLFGTEFYRGQIYDFMLEK